MSVQDITPDAVLAAIEAGHDDVDKLAQHFEVLHVSHTLRLTIAGLAEAGRVLRFSIPGSPTQRLEVVR